MFTGERIKVIKRAERRDSQGALPEGSGKAANNSGKLPERGAAAVVTGWVRELRQKKVAEAARGFESLFRTAA